MAASPSLRARARRRLKPTNRVSIKPISDLIITLRSLQVRSRVPADLLSEYASQVKKAIKRLHYLERLSFRRAGRLNMIRWQVANGARLARCRDADNALDYLLNRQAHRSRNLYAMAQGKRTFLKLGVEHYQRIGKLGAQVRWQRERERKALQILEDYHV